MSNAGEKLRIANRLKSVPVRGDITGPWRSGDVDKIVKTYYVKMTMNEIFSDTCKKFRHMAALGTREFLSEVDERQSNGKVFKKAIYGEYKWQTFGEVRVFNLEFSF